MSPTALPTRSAIDPVGLSWLVTVRWTTMLAGAAAIFAGRSGFGASAPVAPVIALETLLALTNLWLAWRIRREDSPGLGVAGALVSVDVLVLSWVLLQAGGVLNPVSIFYLVEIVLAALVLGWAWTWIITALSVLGYGALFLARSEELRAAGAMHPEIGLHIRGMWLAFAATALLVGLLVARLATAVARRDRALDALHADANRSARLAGLATLAAGAAHELSTPLSTMAVAAHELERVLAAGTATTPLLDDARLIRQEIDRCRRILDDLAGRSTEPSGEAPRAVTLADVVSAALAQLSDAERQRVTVSSRSTATVRWPVGPVAQALANLVRNGLQASDGATPVSIEVGDEGGWASVVVTDQGRGMTAEELARAGEPFFTTKPHGQGMGLGLFVARATVEHLGGTCTLTSTAGRGSVAHVRLPADVVSAQASR